MAEPSYLRSLWFRWRSLQLPWRRKRLCGQDLSGNTFWEFKNPLNPERPRRIVHYPSHVHPSDIAVPPAWLQWLRRTRHDAPTVMEQQLDLQRQDNMKILAAQADQRWREKESFLDKPSDLGQAQPLLRSKGDQGDGYARGQSESEEKEGVRSMVGDQREVQGKIQGKDVNKGRFSGETREKTLPEDHSWKQYNQCGPSDGWQPESWTPPAAGRR